ncbi:MAG: hypothetical protein OFPI_25720 [Osedax symbiont Rs2]|nr:MAG: hypothetical protein OFPI_25720 [Osedax symbiont Rs2]
MIKIFLLTHPREVAKVTNTGRLVTQAISAGNSENVSAQVLLWSRTEPDPLLLSSIETASTLLLYPSEEALSALPAGGPCKVEYPLLNNQPDTAQYPVADACNFIILDGTWQQARKIYNKSPYLKNLHKLHLVTQTQSRYTLRRNQKSSGLCTAESVIELLKLKGCFNCAEDLDNLYQQILIRMQVGNNRV